MNLIKLEDLNAVQLEEIRKNRIRNLRKKTLDEENNKVGEELKIDEIESHLVKNVVHKPKEWGESSRSFQF